MTDSPAQETAKGAFVRRGLLLGGAILVLDQISKWAVLDAFGQSPRAIEILPFANLVLVWNKGISFGLFGHDSTWGPWVLVALAIGISIFLARWMVKAENLMVALGLAAIIGGALGNVVDRVRFGAVVDFLDLHVLGYHWPAFNVADSAITLGAAALILETLLNGSQKP